MQKTRKQNLIAFDNRKPNKTIHDDSLMHKQHKANSAIITSNAKTKLKREAVLEAGTNEHRLPSCATTYNKYAKKRKWQRSSCQKLYETMYDDIAMRRRHKKNQATTITPIYLLARLILKTAKRKERKTTKNEGCKLRKQLILRSKQAFCFASWAERFCCTRLHDTAKKSFAW